MVWNLINENSAGNAEHATVVNENLLFNLFRKKKCVGFCWEVTAATRMMKSEIVSMSK